MNNQYNYLSQIKKAFGVNLQKSWKHYLYTRFIDKVFKHKVIYGTLPTVYVQRQPMALMTLALTHVYEPAAIGKIHP